MTNETEDDVTQPEVILPGNLMALKAEQETRSSIARAHPRNPKKALDDALMELEIAPEYACKAFYVIPFLDRRTGETVNVEGPSIKAAITLARTWGNNDQGWRIKDQSTERVEVEGVYIDFETNTRVVRTKTVSRFYTKKGSNQRIPLKEEALVKAIGAGGSKAVRDSILAGQPFWFTDSYYKKAREIAARTIGGKSNSTKPKTFKEKMAWVEAQITKNGVTPEKFKSYVAGISKDKSEEDLLADLIGLCNALKDGQVKIAEEFGPKEGEEGYSIPEMKKPGETAAPKDQASEPQDPSATFKVLRTGKTTLGKLEGVGVITPEGVPTKEEVEAGWDGRYYSENSKHISIAEEAKGKTVTATYAVVAKRRWIQSIEAAKA